MKKTNYEDKKNLLYKFEINYNESYYLKGSNFFYRKLFFDSKIVDGTMIRILNNMDDEENETLDTQNHQIYKLLNMLTSLRDYKKLMNNENSSTNLNLPYLIKLESIINECEKENYFSDDNLNLVSSNTSDFILNLIFFGGNSNISNTYNNWGALLSFRYTLSNSNKIDKKFNTILTSKTNLIQNNFYLILLLLFVGLFLYKRYIYNQNFKEMITKNIFLIIFFIFSIIRIFLMLFNNFNRYTNYRDNKLKERFFFHDTFYESIFYYAFIPIFDAFQFLLLCFHLLYCILERQSILALAFLNKSIFIRTLIFLIILASLIGNLNHILLGSYYDWCNSFNSSFINSLLMFFGVFEEINEEISKYFSDYLLYGNKQAIWIMKIIQILFYHFILVYILYYSQKQYKKQKKEHKTNKTENKINNE